MIHRVTINGAPVTLRADVRITLPGDEQLEIETLVAIDEQDGDVCLVLNLEDVVRRIHDRGLLE